MRVQASETRHLEKIGLLLLAYHVPAEETTISLRFTRIAWALVCEALELEVHKRRCLNLLRVT